jgi:DNA-binding IclR family transcriptional regulator
VQSVKYTYVKESIEDLFSKEDELLERIMAKLEIAPATLDKHIASLKERKLILPTDARGKYRLNMQIFST